MALAPEHRGPGRSAEVSARDLSVGDIGRQKPSRFGFVVVILFLVFSYVRPQDVVPPIGALRLTLILVPLMVIAWAKSGKFRTAACPQLTLMLYMLALLVVHIPFSTNHYYAFTTAEDFLTLVLTFCVSVILFVDTQERVLSFVRWWIVLALYISIRTIIGHGVAGSSFLADRNDVSLLLNMMLPFVLCMLVYERRVAVRVLYVVVSVVCLAAMVVSASRGGFMGLIAVMAVLCWITPRKAVALLCVCVLGLGAYLFAPQSYWDRMSTIHATNTSTDTISDDPDVGAAEGRLSSWRAGWEMFKDNPLGVGPGNFPVHFPEYQPKSFGRRNMWGRAAHSLWFTLLPELGIPGAVVYALLIRANWRSIWRLHNLPGAGDRHRLAYLLAVAFLASLAGFFVSGTFVSVLFYPHYWYLTAMLVATERVLTAGLSGPGEPLASDISPVSASG